jgi:hypothetical protein
MLTKEILDLLRKKHSAYCEYCHNCDKDYDCKDGNFCTAFKHTSTFSSMRFERLAVGKKQGGYYVVQSR